MRKGIWITLALLILAGVIAGRATGFLLGKGIAATSDAAAARAPQPNVFDQFDGLPPAEPVPAVVARPDPARAQAEATAEAVAERQRLDDLARPVPKQQGY